jgi:hypothetical protein
MKRLEFARRDLLRKLGLGAACLPLLRSGGARAATDPPRRRLVLLQLTEGYRQQSWRPTTGSLVNRALPATVSAFEPWRARTIFLPDLTNPSAGKAGRGAYGVMFYGLGATGGSYKEPTGPTLDQVVAAGLPRGPGQRPSLNLGVQIDRAPRATLAPGGSRCFWTGAGRSITPLADPRAVYRDLFAGGAPQDASVKRLVARRKSILDYVGTSLEGFRDRAPLEDRGAIDSHLAALRSLESQLRPGDAAAFCGTAPPDELNLDDGAQYPRIMDAHLKLIVAALKCGVTSVATLQTGDAEGRNVNASFVPGIPSTGSPYKSAFRTWYDLAHNPILAGTDHKRMLETWFMERFSAFLTDLQAVSEAGQTLLDSTTVVIANFVDDGITQNAQKAPWMVVAKPGGTLATGQCLPGGSSIAGVMAGICEELGVSHGYGEAAPGLKA